MNKTILFATGNDRKVQEARQTFNPYSIGVTVVDMETDEIQHHDPATITKAKAIAAYEVTHEPIVVQDTSWHIPALGGFPGGYMKDVAAWWSVDDWMRIMNGQDRTILCLEHVAYYDGRQVQHFAAEYAGMFVDEPRGSSNGNNSIERCVSLNGKETFAEMHDRGNLASAADTHMHWKLFAEWYSKK
ncbi:hypothetical protein A2707_02135 [Candidatus Saccharibacteria bacterium RIFCSPHIGHO2_01_FULL_45_15]|nr:MAG: hypothetical protein A2707_02135 [Candidatus Saccharibacteria bacterium RIFCSPHIGHO2_01_FULL_45_15]OGL27595.1 MAG: hypothetical protein A3C39_00515 [Candidatus Saccharibacteria bacterium RIFCSPHIGHO2_02_FULL_46_12]OGL31621.1 MAG: hypothetical protein A3E76_00705 [Candidatus Saccharibacteria bacterium RIFCSPHIGHO2_12_FULL_44_22]